MSNFVLSNISKSENDFNSYYLASIEFFTNALSSYKTPKVFAFFSTNLENTVSESTQSG